MSVLDGPGEGTWSAFAMKVVEERDAAREALANSDACWRMEQEFLQRKLAGGDAHIKSLEGLLVDAVRERDEARNEVERLRSALRTIANGFGRIDGSRDDASARQVDGYFRGFAEATLEKKP